MAERNEGTRLRPEREEDEPFLIALYASTRELELAQALWSAAEKALFLRSQFNLQRTHYRTHYADADFCIIEADEQPIGQIYILRSAPEMRLIDIALTPAWRGRGIGRAYLRTLVGEASEAGVPLTLHVATDNPARRLYLRTGFHYAGCSGFYERLAWAPPQYGAGERAKTEDAGQQ